MALTRIQFAVNDNGGGDTSPGITFGAAPASGNKILLGISIRFDAPSVTPPTGFTEITGAAATEVSGAEDLVFRAYQKVAGGSEGTTYSFTLGASAKAVVAGVEVNSSTGAPINLDVVVVAQADSTAVAVATGARGAAHQYLAGFLSHTNIPGWTPGGDFTELGNDQSTGGGNNTRNRLMLHELITTGDSTSKTAAGTIGNAQHWTAAIICLQEGSTSSPVGRSLATTWKVRAPVGLTRSTTWKVLTSVSRTRNTLWGVRALAGRTRNTLWNVRANVTRSFSTSFHVRSLVGLALSTSWDVLELGTSVGRDLSSDWHVRANAGVTLQTSWGILAPVARNLALVHNVRALITRDLALVHNVLTSVTRSVASTWHVRTAISQTFGTTWQTRAPATRSLVTSWKVALPVGRSTSTQWNALTVVGLSLSTAWDVKELVVGLATNNLMLRWHTAAPVGQELATSWNERNAVQEVLSTPWRVRANVGRSFSTSYNILAATADITFVGKGALALNSGSSVSPSYPAGPILANDLMRLVITGRRNLTVFTPPAGWTEFGSMLVNSGITQHLFWKRAVGGESGTVLVNADSAVNGFSASIDAWRGVRSTDLPYESKGSDWFNNGTSMDTSTAATAGARRMLVADFHHAASELHINHDRNPFVGGGSGPITVFRNDIAATGVGHSVSSFHSLAEASGLAYGGRAETTTFGRWIGHIMLLVPEVVLSVTPVGRSLSSTWRVRAAVGRQRSTLWNVLSRVGRSLASEWNVSFGAVVGRSLLVRWNTNAAGECSYDEALPYDEAADYDCVVVSGTTPVGDSLVVRWNVRRPIARTLTTTWNLETALGKSLSTLWNARLSTGRLHTLRWKVQSQIASVVSSDTIGYRVVIRNLTTGRGPGTIVAVFYDASNVGASMYFNAPGEFHMTLPIDHPQASLVLPWRTHYSVERLTPTGFIEVFAGLITDFDATDNEVIFYGVDYLGLYEKLVDTRYDPANPEKAYTAGGSKYVAVPVHTVIQDLNDQALARGDSPVGFLTRESAWTLPSAPNITVYSTFASYGSMIFSLIDSYREGTGQRVRFRVERPTSALYYRIVLSTPFGIDRPPLAMEYGGFIQSFRLIGFGTDFATRALGIGRALDGTKVFYSSQNSNVPLSTYGLIDTANVYEGIADQADLNRRTKQAAMTASRIGKQMALVLRINSLQPFHNWNVGDSLPIRLKRGFLDTSAYNSHGLWTIWGVEWTLYPDSHVETQLVLIPKEGA